MFLKKLYQHHSSFFWISCWLILLYEMHFAKHSEVNSPSFIVFHSHRWFFAGCLYLLSFSTSSDNPFLIFFLSQQEHQHRYKIVAHAEIGKLNTLLKIWQQYVPIKYSSVQSQQKNTEKMNKISLNLTIKTPGLGSLFLSGHLQVWGLYFYQLRSIIHLNFSNTFRWWISASLKFVNYVIFSNVSKNQPALTFPKLHKIKTIGKWMDK